MIRLGMNSWGQAEKRIFLNGSLIQFCPNSSRTKVRIMSHISCYNLFTKCVKENGLWKNVVLAVDGSKRY